MGLPAFSGNAISSGIIGNVWECILIVTMTSEKSVAGIWKARARDASLLSVLRIVLLEMLTVPPLRHANQQGHPAVNML